MPGLDAIVADFELLPDWEDRYRYVIELGRTLTPLSAEEHNDLTKVRGCASQVWLVSEHGTGKDPVLTFRGDSDAHIVRGLIAILIALMSGRRASDIAALDAKSELAHLGLEAHLSSQRSNGLYAMLARMRAVAQAAIA